MTHIKDLEFDVMKKNLSAGTRAKLRAWTEGVIFATDSPDTKHGLWLFGERRAGTSYTAKVVVADLAVQHGLTDSHQVRALDLIDMVRGSWSMSAQVRSSMDDLALWWELKNTEEMLDTYFWRLDVLWIDQLHHETIDMAMWKKHIQPRIEARVEEGMITVISTTMTPGDRALPKNVIEDLFTTILCEDRFDAGR